MKEIKPIDTSQEDNYFKELNEKFNKLKRIKQNRSIEEKVYDFKLEEMLLDCYGEKMSEPLKEYLIKHKREYFTQNQKKAYYPPQWIAEWEKKHAKTLSLAGASLARAIILTISNYNV